MKWFVYVQTSVSEAGSFANFRSAK